MELNLLFLEEAHFQHPPSIRPGGLLRILHSIGLTEVTAKMAAHVVTVARRSSVKNAILGMVDGGEGRGNDENPFEDDEGGDSISFMEFVW